MAKRKSVDLTGSRKNLESCCHKCGAVKRLQYRKFGRKRRIYGASEAAPVSRGKD